MTYIIITKKIWHKKNFLNIIKKNIILNNIEINKIKKLKPKLIFFIHWSKFIPEFLYKNYTCIQFHSSDLPLGRGGSPIQNQILRNFKKTKISAFKVSKIIDGGPICMKKNLLLKGNAMSIYQNMEKTCVEMIKKIIKKKKINFNKQIGKPSYFKRRKPSESEINISKFDSISSVYNFLRMLDAPGYPNAFINLKNFKFTFNHVKKKNKLIEAKVQITKYEK